VGHLTVQNAKAVTAMHDQHPPMGSPATAPYDAAFRGIAGARVTDGLTQALCAGERFGTLGELPSYPEYDDFDDNCFTLPPEQQWEGPAAGTLIDGTYRVIGPLGQGGMGTVLLAVDEQLERDVAIKLIRPSQATTDKVRARFLTEARAMARTRHPNVVEIYAFGEIDGVPYFAMEHVPGTSIADWLDGLLFEGKLPGVEQALDCMDGICQGLAAIHSSGTLHGDLKPSNILLGAYGRVAIADLGLSRLFDLQSGEAGEHPMAGTPAYMAPEYACTDLSSELLKRSDVYALGVLAYELLSGDTPFGIISPEDMLAALGRRPEPISRRRPELRDAFDGVLARALEPDPHTRTPSVEHFRRELIEARRAWAAGRKSLRILVADDDADFRELAWETLSYAFPGAAIELHEGGATALAAHDAEPADLLVIDLEMPDLNGVELTAAVRAHHDVPIVVCTANGGAGDWRLLSSLGADGFLVKPLDPFALATVAQNAVGAGGIQPL